MTEGRSGRFCLFYCLNFIFDFCCFRSWKTIFRIQFPSCPERKTDCFYTGFVFVRRNFLPENKGVLISDFFFWENEKLFFEEQFLAFVLSKNDAANGIFSHQIRLFSERKNFSQCPEKEICGSIFLFGRDQKLWGGAGWPIGQLALMAHQSEGIWRRKNVFLLREASTFLCEKEISGIKIWLSCLHQSK